MARGAASLAARLGATRLLDPLAALTRSTAAPASPAAQLAARLATPTDAVGSHVSDFLSRFEAECAAHDAAWRAAREATREVTVAREGGEGGEGVREGGEGAREGGEGAREGGEGGACSEVAERALAEAVSSIVTFETALLDALYTAGLAQPVEAAGRGAPPPAGTAVSEGPAVAAETVGGGCDEGGGLLRLAWLVEQSFMPRCLELLRPLYQRARGAADEALRQTRQALRLRHPEVLGLREPLLLSGGVPSATVLEASWLYSDAVDALLAIGTERTVAGKLVRLSRVLEAFVGATRGCLSDGLSADDLVPLLTLVLVVSRAEIGFEGFVLDALTCDLVASGSGRASYCAVTLAVALGFLREVQQSPPPYSSR